MRIVSAAGLLRMHATAVLCLMLVSCMESADENANELDFCGGRVIGVGQVLTSNLDAGLRIRESYKLTDRGTLSSAIWNDDNQLVALSDVGRIDALEYLKIAELPDNNTSVPIPEDDHTVGSPVVDTAEIIVISDAGANQYVFSETVSSALTQKIDLWRAAISLETPQSGRYVWALPVDHIEARLDLNISASICADDFNSVLIDALLDPHMVVRIPDELTSIGEFFQAGRARYAASYGDQFFYFGILDAP